MCHSSHLTDITITACPTQLFVTNVVFYISGFRERTFRLKAKKMENLHATKLCGVSKCCIRFTYHISAWKKFANIFFF